MTEMQQLMIYVISQTHLCTRDGHMLVCSHCLLYVLYVVFVGDSVSLFHDTNTIIFLVCFSIQVKDTDMQSTI